MLKEDIEALKADLDRLAAVDVNPDAREAFHGMIASMRSRLENALLGTKSPKKQRKALEG